MASPMPTPAVRQQTSDKNDFASCVSKDLLDFQYRHITTIFFIRCYGKKVKVKAFPYSIPSVGPELIPVYRQSARSHGYDTMANGPYYGRFAVP